MARTQVEGSGRSYLVLFYFLLLGATLFRLWYIYAGNLALAPDEAHYWEWSRQPALSYYSKGPMVAYLIFLFTRLGGATEFWVRLPAVLLFSGAAILLYLIAWRLFFSHRVAFLAGLTALSVPLFAAGSILMTIDAPFLFFWVLACYLALRAVSDEGRLRHWLFCGLALGLGFLSKYTMVLFVPSFFLYLCSHPKGRSWLKKKEPYLVLALGLFISLPVLYWNAAHQWLSVKHVFGQGGLGQGAFFNPRYFGQFLGSQLGVISPLLFIALIFALIKSYQLGRRSGEAGYLFVFYLSFPTLLLFFLLSLHSKVQANWAAAGYPLAIVAWAGLLNRSEYARPFFRWSAGLTLALALAMSVVGHKTDIVYQLYPNLNPAHDPTNRLRGWRELGQEVGRIVAEGNNLFIFSDRYQLASELAFYTPGNPRTYNINVGRRLNQYDMWNGWSELKGRDGLYVKSGLTEIEPEAAQAFNECKGLPPLTVMRKGQAIKSFSFFLCQGFQGVLPERSRHKY